MNIETHVCWDTIIKHYDKERVGLVVFVLQPFPINNWKRTKPHAHVVAKFIHSCNCVDIVSGHEFSINEAVATSCYCSALQHVIQVAESY